LASNIVKVMQNCRQTTVRLNAAALSCKNEMLAICISIFHHNLQNGSNARRQLQCSL